MKKTISLDDVLIKNNNDNTITIMKSSNTNQYSTRNNSQPKIVVRYFNDDDLLKLKEIQVTPINLGKPGTLAIWREKVVSFILNKNRELINSSAHP